MISFYAFKKKTLSETVWFAEQTVFGIYSDMFLMCPVVAVQKGKVEMPQAKGVKRPREDAAQGREESETKASKRSKTQVREDRAVLCALTNHFGIIKLI